MGGNSLSVSTAKVRSRFFEGPYFERSLCFCAYNIVRRAYMNFRRPRGAYSKPDTKNPIQGSLRKHDVVPGR